MTSRQKPPFRGDMVGSLLRSAPVKDARDKVAAGEMTPAELTTIEDEEIRKLVTQAGGDRPAGGDRRRIPPRLLAFRLPGQPDRRRHGYESDSGIQFKGVATKARRHPRHRQARLPRRPPASRAFQVPGLGHQPRAEDDDPEPIDAALSRRAEGDRLPAPTTRWMTTTTISARPTPRRSRPSTMPAAATCSSTTPACPISAIPSSARC